MENLQIKENMSDLTVTNVEIAKFTFMMKFQIDTDTHMHLTIL